MRLHLRSMHQSRSVALSHGSASSAPRALPVLGVGRLGLLLVGVRPGAIFGRVHRLPVGMIGLAFGERIVRAPGRSSGMSLAGAVGRAFLPDASPSAFGPGPCTAPVSAVSVPDRPAGIPCSPAQGDDAEGPGNAGLSNASRPIRRSRSGIFPVSSRRTGNPAPYDGDGFAVDCVPNHPARPHACPRGS